MTCYMRHMGWLFALLDLDKDAGNRHRLDRAIKHALGMPEDAPCPEVNARLKSLSEGEQFDLIDTLEREFAE